MRGAKFRSGSGCMTCLRPADLQHTTSFLQPFPGKLPQDVQTLSRASAASPRGLSARQRRTDAVAIISSRQLSRVLQFALGCCVRDTCLCLISIVTSECLTQPLTYRRNPSRSLIKLSRSFVRLWLVQPELSLEIRAIWQWYECRHLGR